MTLGDSAVPFGLWKAIEHMRRGEKSLITIKPKHAFGKDEPNLVFPPGYESGENKAIICKRRVYYEIKLHDWLIKHDLDGDGLMIKTIYNKGVGYDRPFDHDEIVIDLKVYQIF